MHTISEVAAIVLRTTHGPDDVTPIYQNGSIYAISISGKRYRLDTDDARLDDLLRLLRTPRKLN